MELNQRELRDFLDAKTAQYNRPEFIADDPISIPHQYSRKEDIEIIAFLVATIAWGRRELIIKSSRKLVDLMDGAPDQFVRQFTSDDLGRFDGFVHRTFQPYDVKFFLERLQQIVLSHGSIEHAFEAKTAGEGIQQFRNLMLDAPHEQRVLKHLPNISRGAAAKRLNMFLRWMVRRDANGVDFGIWNALSPDQLYLPLDVHTARVSRKLGLLTRKANDWKAVEEVTQNLRLLDPKDPVKYDFALFSLGAVEQF